MIKIILFLLLLSNSCFAKDCFITLHHTEMTPKGINILINKNHIISVYPSKERTEINISGGSIYVVESFKEVSKKIKDCKN